MVWPVMKSVVFVLVGMFLNFPTALNQMTRPAAIGVALNFALIVDVSVHAGTTVVVAGW